MNDLFKSFSYANTLYLIDFYRSFIDDIGSQQDPCELFEKIYFKCATNICKLFTLKWIEDRIK